MPTLKISNLLFTKINRVAVIFLLIPLMLSAFTHLWNPVGFPDIFYDEGVYMYRAMNVLAGLGPQTNSFHDHPFFGQFFLAGALSLTGYPDSLHPTSDVHSIETLYLVPRVLMGSTAPGSLARGSKDRQISPLYHRPEMAQIPSPFRKAPRRRRTSRYANPNLFRAPAPETYMRPCPGSSPDW